MIIRTFKRMASYSLLICLFFCLTALPYVYADDVNEGEYSSEVFLSKTVDESTNPPRIEAAAAIVLDTVSGRVLYEKNANTRRSIASTTKIMTAIVAIESGELDDIVTVSKRAASVSGSNIGLKIGEKLKLRELLYGLMLNSGNDAAIAIAEHIAGSVENFASMMNSKAEELGLKDTSFKTPHGLDMNGHYSTAYELALMAKYALGNPVFSEIVSTLNTQIPGRSLYNTNELLGFYPGADGVKTGYTGQAGRCLVTSVTRNNWRIVSVALGCSTRLVRSDSSIKMLDYAFNNYKLYTLLRKDENVKTIGVVKGKIEDLPILAVDGIKFPLKHDELDKLKTEIEIPKLIKAPVRSGIEVGSIKFVLDGKVIAMSKLKTGLDIQDKGVVDYFGELFYKWGRIIREAL